MFNPRKERIVRLNKKLERLSNNLQKKEYRSSLDAFADFVRFTETELEIQIQTAYLQHEENSNG